MRICAWKLVRGPTLGSGLLSLVPRDCYTLLGAPLSPQVCTVFHTSTEKNALRKPSVLRCSATTSTAGTFATGENGFSTLASDIFIVVLMTLWQNHNSCFYPRTFDFILQAASCLLTDSIFYIYPVSANNISKQLGWASCLCHSR